MQRGAEYLVLTSVDTFEYIMGLTHRKDSYYNKWAISVITHCLNTDKSDEQETMIQKRTESSFKDPVVSDCYGVTANDLSNFKSDTYVAQYLTGLNTQQTIVMI